MVEETFSILHKTRLKDMYRIAVILLTALLLASCGRKETLADIEARAGATAVEYYRLLQEGKYADFVAGLEYSDSLPEDYRSQLADNAAMFIHQQNTEHRGIKEITLERCKADTSDMTAVAHLNILYADSVKEVVCVPLVMQDKIWRMK